MVIGLTPYPQHCLMSMSTDRLNDQSIDNFEQDCPSVRAGYVPCSLIRVFTIQSYQDAFRGVQAVQIEKRKCAILNSTAAKTFAWAAAFACF
jgi:hypothetical protein